MRENPLILVVDDDPGMRFLERASPEQAGFAVEEAEDGEKALDVFPRLRPDMVLLTLIVSL